MIKILINTIDNDLRVISNEDIEVMLVSSDDDRFTKKIIPEINIKEIEKLYESK